MTGDQPDREQTVSVVDNRRVRSMVFRWALMGIGWLAVAGGVVGIFLPLVPTVPLLLLAAACFARSSDRFHQRLVNHDRLGPLIKGYLEGGGIPWRAKATAIGMIWVSVPTSAFFFVQIQWVRVALLAIAAGVTVYLVQLPGPESGQEDEE